MLTKLIFFLGLFAAAYGQCGNVLVSKELNETMKVTVTKMHNDFRYRIAKGEENQPAGTNLFKMQYDEELAKQARMVTNTCTNQHIFAIINNTRQGQNLYMSRHMYPDPEPNWQEAFDNWTSEKKYFTYPDQSGGKVTTHYTTVVWAVNFKLGCAYTYFQLVGQSLPYRKFYCCNYGPKSDNIQGEAPYSLVKLNLNATKSSS